MNNEFSRTKAYFYFPFFIFIFFCLYCFRFFVDDTYINFIAAKNLVEIGKLSANLEQNVNPTTANFHMLLSALVYLVTGPEFIEMGVKILGLFSGLGILALLDKTLEILKVEKKFRFISLLLTATSFPFILWTVSAMDTVFDAAVITLTTYFWIKDGERFKDRAFFLFSCFLLILARLDFAILSFIFLFGFFIKDRNVKSKINPFLLFYVLPVLIMLTSLKFYYGTIVPTPVQKASFGLIEIFNNIKNFGAEYFFHFCILNLNIISIGSILIISVKHLKKINIHNSSLKLLVIAAALISYVGYIMSQGSVHMMFAFRFYTPLIPILTLFTGLLLNEISVKYKNKFRFSYVAFLGAFIFSINTSTFFYGYYKNLNFSEIPGGDFSGMKNNHIKGWILLHEGMKKAAVHFGSLIQPEAKVFLGVAGVIPFYLNRPAYDNGLLGSPKVWGFDYVISGCDSIKEVPAGFFRHELTMIDPETLYYPFSSWCLRQVDTSQLKRINNLHENDMLSTLPIQNIDGFVDIVDMAADLSCRYYVENKKWTELVQLLNKLNSLSDRRTGKRELKSYYSYLPDEFKAKLLNIEEQ